MPADRVPRGGTHLTELADGVVQLSFTVHAALARVAAAHGLSVTQLRLLGILRDRSPRMSDLADHLGLDRSSVSGLVDRAAARGLVSRAPDGRDGRSMRLALTPAGRALGAELERDLAGRLGRMLETLDEDQREVLDGILGRLLPDVPGSEDQ